MQIWRYVLAGSVVASLAFIPQGVTSRKAEMPTLNENPMFASLKLQKHTPTNILPARSPVSFFSAKQNKPLSGVTICVDPGHGGQFNEEGYTGGTTGIVTGQTEGDVNLRVSLILRQYLEAAGANVVLTRKANNRCQDGVCLRDELDFRTNTAKRAKADFFVSVHHNEAGKSKPEVNYTTVFFPKGCSSSPALAANISNSVSKYMGIRNVGAKVGDYRVLNQLSGIPGVIVEASFMSNPTEDRKLANVAYNKMEAKAIATGVLNYFRTARGKDVDFNQIFAPLDDQAHSAQAMADSTIIRKQVVERKSMFSKSYEEVTVDRSGRQVARRSLGSSSKTASASTAKKTTTVSKSSGKKEVVVAKPSSKVTKFVEDSKQSAKSLSSSNKAKVVLSERNSKVGLSKPVI